MPRPCGRGIQGVHMKHVIPLKLTTLTPYNYGHLMVSGGVATIPDVIGDRAFLFALSAAFGKMSRSLSLPEKDVLTHIRAMPWRCSLFTTPDPKLLRPIARRSDLGIEGGYQDKVRRAAASGNFKEFFTIQEVPAFQEFTGVMVSDENPFELADAENFCVRIGSNRTGMLKVERADVSAVRLNVATAKIFGRAIPSERYLLNQLSLSPTFDIDTAAAELSEWA